MTKEAKAPIPRTSAGLRDALFEEMDALRNGTTNSTKANATAKIAMAIVGTVEMELAVHKVMSKIPQDQPKIGSLPTLSLTSASE